MEILLLLPFILSIAACNDIVFEALSDNQRIDTDSEPEEESDSVPDNNDVSWRDVFEGIEACAHLTPQIPAFDTDETFVVGDGTPGRCQEFNLVEAIDWVNENGRGRIEFNCGGTIHSVKLTSSLYVADGVELSMDGGMNIVLDGRKVFRILNAGAGSSLFFERLIFMDGKAVGNNGGGAVYIENSESSGRAVFSECVFEGNVSEQGVGGAIYAYRLARMEIFRSVFQQNSSATGGAIFNYGDDIQIANTDFYGNSVFQNGGGIVFIEDETNIESDTDEHVFSVCGTRFSNNFSIGDGSGLHIQQAEGSLTAISYSEFLQNSTSEEFTPSDGAGVLHVRGGLLTLDSSSFIRNTSTSSVGGIYMNTDRGFEAENCTFFLNSSEEGNGGAIYQRGDKPGLIRNCSFVRNSAADGGAIYRESGTTLQIDNSIFIDNLNSDNEPAACNATFSGDNNFEWVYGFADVGTACTSSSTIEDAFLMLPAYNGGFVLTCRLDPASVARDAGESCPAMDARGEARSTPCDAGAYEVIDDEK